MLKSPIKMKKKSLRIVIVSKKAFTVLAIIWYNITKTASKIQNTDNFLKIR